MQPSKSVYLYGEGVKTPEIPKEVITGRLKPLNDHLKELLAIHFMDRDNSRVTAVLKAIEFWENINEN